jgi:Transcriptional regulator containing PAS, AAA-type ATPase, and DNA-binding domains
MLRIAADSDISVLLLGESGSGKEVAAQFIHNHSKRASGPFVRLTVALSRKDLPKASWKGTAKGAFTGASEERLGIVRSANHGTLFLDEIGEMPLETQCKLLRILQERTVMPIGDYEAFPVDFRLICATNRDLRSDICAGKFREDLFFRINVFPITIPPLRERADFENIANDLWYDAQKIYSTIPDASKQSRHFDEFEMFLLKSKQWPGNIRQLKTSYSVTHCSSRTVIHSRESSTTNSQNWSQEKRGNLTTHGCTPRNGKLSKRRSSAVGATRAKPHRCSA